MVAVGAARTISTLNQSIAPEVLAVRAAIAPMAPKGHKGAPTFDFSSGREDEFGRISGLDAGNQGVCIPGSWRYWRVPVTPERRASHGSIQAGVLQMSVETDAEKLWCRFPAASPNG